MGEQIRWSVSVRSRTAQLVEKWRQKFAPFTEDSRSATLCLIVDLWDRAATDPRVVPLLEALQLLQGVTASQLELDFPVATTGKKPPCRVAPSEDPKATVRRLAYSATSGDEVTATYRITPFLLKRLAA